VPSSIRRDVLSQPRMESVFGLTAGEAFIVVFVAIFIVTSPYWSRLGGWIGKYCQSREDSEPAKK
jgi:hypothetical protein